MTQPNPDPVAGLLLSDEERERFRVYLERTVESNKGMIEQMEKISIPAAVVEKLKRETVACAIVARILAQTHRETL